MDWHVATPGYCAAPMRILYVVGTRPNFVKMAPVIAAMRTACPDGRHVIVHTGQHYDRAMSEVFFEELGVPAPDHMLEVGSGTHAAADRAHDGAARAGDRNGEARTCSSSLATSTPPWRRC